MNIHEGNGKQWSNEVASEESVLLMCRGLKAKLADILRNKFDFWNVHEIMNTSGLLQSK